MSSASLGAGSVHRPLRLPATIQTGLAMMEVKDALKLDRPILVGESFGGAELSSIGSRYPNRVAGLVYLDAAYWYAFDNAEGVKHGGATTLPRAATAAAV